MKSLLRLRGKFKGYFFLLHLHTIVPSKIFSFFGHLSSLSKWIQQHRVLGYNDFYNQKFKYAKRFDMFEYLIEKEELNKAIDYFEFGVSKGASFRWWVSKNKHPESKFYGFDTFTGLPEDWGPFKAGDMSNNNEPPKIEDNRHLFFQGLFQQTLMPFLKEYQSNRKKIIHLDADLYTATLYVLSTIAPYLNKGDILLFDEFNVPCHEFKAFTEWSQAFYIDYEVLAAVNNYYQVAVKIK
ncbi:MAG: hypothetical protein JXR60_03825 [Bacteroidales bacterium]|nr:hypothetical protein [Bacteroidales bacterium]